MNNELKVSFYLKREGNTERTETNPDAVFPIVGKIIIGNTIAQFGSKQKIEERLWNVKSGRAIGKSRIAVELNREINKINLSIHAHYRDILKRNRKSNCYRSEERLSRNCHCTKKRSLSSSVK